MGGGGGGGYSPPIDLKKLTEKANQRIQQALSQRRQTVFVCADSDADELQRLINASRFGGRDYSIVTEVDSLREAIEGAGLVIFFVDKSEDHTAIDAGIVIAAELKTVNFFVHARVKYSIPSYVSQFRVRMLTWDQFLEVVVD